MNKYITTVELSEYASEFATIIGVRGFMGNYYVCESIDENGNRIHQQSFPLKKNIEGFPTDEESLKADVLESWKKEETKRKKAQGFDTE